MTDKILLYKDGTLSAGNFIETAGSPIFLQKGSKILCSEFIEAGGELFEFGIPYSSGTIQTVSNFSCQALNNKFYITGTGTAISELLLNNGGNKIPYGGELKVNIETTSDFFQAGGSILFQIYSSGTLADYITLNNNNKTGTLGASNGDYLSVRLSLPATAYSAVQWVNISVKNAIPFEFQKEDGKIVCGELKEE